MIFNNVLDEVFSKWSQIAVLRVLQDSAVGMSGREIARLSNFSPKQCLIALTNLEDIGIVRRQRGGRDHLFTINFENILVDEGILPLLKLERDYLNKLLLTIKKKLGKHTVSLILFGSVARKEETVTSDVDICVIIKSRDQKEMAEEIIYSLSSALARQYGAKISPIFFTTKEFITKAKKNKSPVNEIKKEGKVFSGKSIREIIDG